MIKKFYLLLFVICSIFSANGQYCIPTTSCTFPDIITNVTFGTINRTSTCDAPTGGYSTWPTPVPGCIQGLSYPISVSTGGDVEGIMVWIDYNQNFIFESTEAVFTPAFAGTNPATYSGNIVIPFTATPGNTGMRVRCKFNGVPLATDNNPCLTYTYGETEDYVVTIVAATPCAGMPTAGTTIAQSVTPCPGVSNTLSLQGASLLNNLSYQWIRGNTTNCTPTGWQAIPAATNSTYTIPSSAGTRVYRCVVTCLNSGLKDTSSPLCIQTQAWSPTSSCWCIPTYTTASATQNINVVSVGALNNNTTAALNPAPNYVDYTAQQLAGTMPIPILFAGINNVINVTNGSATTNYSRIWIDCNHDGTFAQTTVESASTSVNAGANGVNAINFTPSQVVPLGTTLAGVTRMRVRGGSPTDVLMTQPCGATSSTTGEAEDYLVNILAQTTHDPAVTAIQTPTGNCYTNCEPVTVTVTNYGSSNINLFINPITLTLKVTGPNGLVTYTLPVTGVPQLNANAGNSTTITFPCVDLYAGGTYSINTSLTIGSANGVVNGYPQTDSLFSPVININYRPTPGPAFEVCQNQSIGFGQGLTVSGCGNTINDSIEIVFNVAPCIDNVGSNFTFGGTTQGPPHMCLNTASCDFASAIIPALPISNPNFLYAEYYVNNYSTTFPAEPRFVLYANQDPSILSNIYNPSLQGQGPAGANIYNVGVSSNQATTPLTRKYTRRVNGTILSDIFKPANIGTPINVGYWESYNDVMGSDITPNVTAPTEVRMKVYYSYVPSKINWYDNLTSTTILDTLVPFNPLSSTVLNGSGQLSNTSNPGTYTFFATCDGSDCRVPVNLVINPSPTVIQDTVLLCEDAPGSNQAVFNLCSVQGQVSAFASGVTVGFYTDAPTLNQIPLCLDTTGSSIIYTKVTALGCSSVDTLALEVKSLPQFIGGGVLVGNACAPTTLDAANLINFAVVPSGSDTLYFENAACTMPHPNPHNIAVADTVWIVLKTNTTPACTDTAVAYIDVTPALNLITNQNVVGQYSSTGTVPAVTNTLADGDNKLYTQLSDCRKVASIEDIADGTSLGTTTIKQEIAPSTLTHNGQPYVNRVYEVIPTTQTPAQVCLYYLDDDINIYNQDAPGFGFNAPMSSSNFTITQTHNGDVTNPNHTFTVIPNSSITSSYDPSTTVWTLCFPVDSFSFFYLHTQNPVNAALPISLLSFTGKRVENSSVLKWSTTKEENNDYFEITRSRDGKTFSKLSEKIGSKGINGTSTETLSYSYTDNIPNEGHNYYRLQQTDRDGKTTNSINVVDVYFGNETMVTLYPNPAQQELNVDINISKATNAKMRIIDATGRVVKQIDMSLKSGGNQTKVSLEGLSDGMYMIQITNEKGLNYSQTIRKN